MTQRDPIFFEIFRNALNSVVDDMALTIYRTAYSGVLKDVMDYSTALCAADGRLVAQGLTLPGHLGSMPDAMAAIIARYGQRLHPGDILCLNDPYEGGMHLPDIFVVKPIFVDGQVAAWAATVCHHTDVGGRVAGSNASDSTEIFQEGLRIPPLKLYEAGEPNEALFRLLEKNVRLPVRLFGDLRAQLAACHGAETAFLRLVDRYGLARVLTTMDDLIDYSERLTRATLRELPDGAWTFEDWIDDDGVDYGRPIRLFVTVRKEADHLTIDWTGSAAQVRGAINSTMSYTKAASYCCVKSILDADIPNNEGFFRAVSVVAPAGTVVHGAWPAACAARGLTGFRMVDCLFGALAQIVPARIPAASEGGNTGISIGGYGRDRRPFVYVDFICSAWGGRPTADGIDGAAHPFANVSAQPIEICEREQPLAFDCCEFIQDSGGPGLHRGGCGLRRDYRFLEQEAVLQVRADRIAFQPYGLAGGSSGQPGRNLLQPGTERQEVLPGKFLRTLHRDDVFRVEIAGAGGWGDPLARDPERVLADVRDGYVSRQAAARDYGVVLDQAGKAVDTAATTARRAALAVAPR